MSTVITVENLGKKYTLSHQREPYTALRDVLAENVRNAGRRITSLFSQPRVSGNPSPTSEEFWALRDVSFEVKQGDRIGIIGRNGAGKSTLLKILSRITEPTTGSVRIKGRVASLLEVGTGFHPELTGRENIFLNGAILGMSRVEIKKKFDEIVDFAEIERFLDTPVKRYSSGMYVRLAFAVAAHLEPEILVVDEVLAVGDAQFQKKCLGRMEEVGKEGRTVIFVSHNLDSINYLCSSGILLHQGGKVCEGGIEEVTGQYQDSVLKELFSQGGSSLYQNQGGCGTEYHVQKLSLLDEEDNPLPQVRTFDSFSFIVDFHAPEHCDNRSAAIFISKFSGENLLRLDMSPYTSFRTSMSKGLNTLRCHVERLPLPAGNYALWFAIRDNHSGEWVFDQELCLFEVGSCDIHNCGLPPLQRHAVTVCKYRWEQL